MKTALYIVGSLLLVGILIVLYEVYLSTPAQTDAPQKILKGSATISLDPKFAANIKDSPQAWAFMNVVNHGK